MPPAHRIAVIAHRGASGYLPEHTLEAKALAHGQGADFLEQDLVLTRDGVPIVLHDIYLDSVTDVARVFPGRQRSDGRYYAIDFTLAEIQQLRVSERFDPVTGQAVFPRRYPPHQGNFRIPTFAEEIEFIRGLNHSSGRTAGLYPEIKKPAFHLREGQDITPIVLQVLSDHQYSRHGDPVFVQCFDAAELRRIREQLGCKLRLIQLLQDEPWLSPAARPEEIDRQLRTISEYADGIGPPVERLFLVGSSSLTGGSGGGVSSSELVARAHGANLVVHPWTYRADDLPKGFASFTDLHRASQREKVDAIFSDFPDQSRQLLDAGTPARSRGENR